MDRHEILKIFMHFNDKQREREKDYHRITNLDKKVLITTTMKRFGIQFEPAEHIVELAVGNEDLTTLSLAEASGLIINIGESLVKGG